MVNDQLGTPTYALDLAKATIVVLTNYDSTKRGIYHFSNEGVCSWYDFATEIAAAAGHTECRINPCHSDEFPSKVTRPPYSVLDKSKVKRTFDVEIPHWRESMIHCINRLKQK